MDGTTSNSKVIVVFRLNSGVITTQGLSTFGHSMVGGAGGNLSQTISMNGVSVPVVGVAAAASRSALLGFSTASPSFDATVTGGFMTVGYKIYNSAPANHSVGTTNPGVDNWLTSGYAIPV